MCQGTGGCCGSGRSCCCCCCDSRGASICFSIIGLLLATGVVAPPVYVYLHSKDYTSLLPMINWAEAYLHKVVSKADPGVELRNGSLIITNGSNVTEDTITSDKYTLAIFQLLDDTRTQSKAIAFVSFAIGCLNVPLDLFLFIGATFRFSCCILPWLFFTMIEIVVVGIPVIVYSGLISLYISSQFALYVEAGILTGVFVFIFFFSLSSWLTVYDCYQNCSKGSSFSSSPDLRSVDLMDAGITQPLLSHSDPHPTVSMNGGYHLRQYPQYYPPHGGRQLPSAPPSNSGIYPALTHS